MKLSKLICGNCTLRDELGFCFWLGSQVETDKLSCFRLFPGGEEENFVDKGYFHKTIKEREDVGPIEVDFERVKREAKADLEMFARWDKEREASICKCSTPMIDDRKRAKIEISLTTPYIQCWCKTCGKRLRNYISPSDLPKKLKERYVEFWNKNYDPET